MVTTRGGVGEDLVPFREGLVGGDDRRALLIPAGDDFEEQIGVAGVVGQVPELVADHEQRGRQ